MQLMDVFGVQANAQLLINAGQPMVIRFNVQNKVPVSIGTIYVSARYVPKSLMAVIVPL